jgi:hypothetical protein
VSTGTGSKRDYPLPRAAEDPRFTQGLSIDVAKVLAEHGYPKITEGRDLLKLQEALFTFLYEPLTSGQRQERP